MVQTHWPPTKEEDEEFLRTLKALSPEGFINVQKDWTRIFVKALSESKTAEEMIELRDKMLGPTPFPSTPLVTAEIKKNFHELLLRKNTAPFKALNGGRAQKKISKRSRVSLICKIGHHGAALAWAGAARWSELLRDAMRSYPSVRTNR